MVNSPQEFDAAGKSFDWNAKLHSYYFHGKLLLQKYWWLLVLTMGVGAGYQAYDVYNTDPVYSSNAQIMLSGFVASPIKSGVEEQFGYWFGNQISILRSPAVQREARERVYAFHPDMQPARVSVLARQVPETAIIQITASGDSRDYTRVFLDALLDEYMNWRPRMKGETSERALLAVIERIDALETKMAQQEEALVDFRRNHNLIFIQEQSDRAGSNLVSLRNRESEMRTQLRLLRTLDLETQLDSPEIIENTRIFTTDAQADYRQVRRELDRLRAQLNEFSIYLRPQHPKIIAIREDIERTENLKQILREQAVQRLQQREREIQNQLENLQVVIAEQEQVALENSRLAAEFERINSNLALSRSLYENLLRSIQTLETGREMDTEIVNILERATPSVESRPNLTEHITKGVFAGLFIGVGLMVGIGFIDNRVITAEDLEERFQKPILGIIPKEKRIETGEVGNLSVRDKRHLFAEAFRTLRSSVFFRESSVGKPTVILVTSSVPGEGKSTVSLNLAIAISFTSSKTLLVDGDLRRGNLAKRLGAKRGAGLSELLEGKHGLDELIQHTGVPNLDLLPAGSYPERPSELLLSQRMLEVLESLKDRYTHIVIDTSPVLVTDDTTGFALNADAVLFVARAAATQSRQVKTATERLKLRGSEIDGFILNCVDTRGTDYYYYQKYQDYYAKDRV